MRTRSIENLLRNLPNGSYEKTDGYWLCMAFHLQHIIEYAEEPENGGKNFLDAWKSIQSGSPLPDKYEEELRTTGNPVEPFEINGSRNLWKQIFKYLSIEKQKLSESQDDLEFLKKLSENLVKVYEAKKGALWHSYIEFFKISFGGYGWRKNELSSGKEIYEYYSKEHKYRHILQS